MASAIDKIKSAYPAASSAYSTINDTTAATNKTAGKSVATGVNSVLNKTAPASSASTTTTDASSAGAVNNNSNLSKLSSYYNGVYGSLASSPTASTQTEQAATTEETATPSATMYSPTTIANTGKNTTTNTSTSNYSYTPTGMYDPANLAAYNQQRENSIRSLYADAQKSTLAGLKTAYDQNLSTAQAARDLINPQYQSSANALSAEYERQRRNNNMQAAANGLNTGAGSQMALAQSANYQANQAGLAQKQNQALDEANRAITDLKINYQNAIAEATANNNYKLAASLFDEYENAYNRQMTVDNTNYTRAWNEEERSYDRGLEEASNKAQYGDFSGYAALYGDKIAKAMELTWALQNPQIAYAAGKLSAEDYETLTGSTPNSSTSSTSSIATSGVNGLLNIGTTPSYSSSSRSGRGYSASRDRAYRGPAGYLNSDGEFVVPAASWGGSNNITAAQGHENDASNAWDTVGVTYNTDTGTITKKT